ncbi:MAG: ISNCY family transposase [Lentisphaerae bacterium]|nr:ISNCY family transposase [Lentisphaerota bacterium]
MKEGYITLSQKQLKRLKVMNAYMDGTIDRKRASELLSLSERQISRLKKGLMTQGETFLIHKNSNRRPAHAISSELKEKILQTHSLQEFESINFLHFNEILAEQYDIQISYTALSSILKSEGKKSPKSKKVKRRRNRRKRRDCPGELIQIDATPFDWFRDGRMLSLHGAIDDASGVVIGLYLCENECLSGYFETMRQCVLSHGVPQSIYSDNHTIFRSPKAGKLTVEEVIAGKTVNLTQFGRAMHEMGTDIIYAKTSWAKGRIERLWDTLQSRLPVELARRRIKTIEAANQFLLEEYISKYNQKFAVKPEGESIFVPLRSDIDIDTILCIKKKRKTDAASCFSFKGRTFKINTEGYPLVPARKEVEVLIGPRIGIKVRYQNHVFEAIQYLKPDRKDANLLVRPKVKKAVKPHIIHSTEKWKLIWHSEPYDLSLKFLYELFFDKDAC